MDNVFNEAAFNAPIGELVGPVETSLGLHLIEILNRDDNNDQVHARHILLKYETSRETIENLWNKSRHFYESVTKTKGKNFNEIAKKENYTVIETPPFLKGEFVPTLGIVASINSLTFNEDVDWVCQPRSVIENIIVFQIKEIQKSHISDLKEVESNIRLRIQREKRKKGSGEICIQIREKIKQGSEFEKIADENSLTILETGLFGLNSMISRVGRDPSFAGTALRLNVGDVSSPVESDRGFYLIKVIERMEADKEHFQVEKNSLKLALLQQKTNMLLSAWHTTLIERSNIQDFRYYFLD
jgi:parvulin-like peptidyl-prolyl isomerase